MTKFRRKTHVRIYHFEESGGKSSIKDMRRNETEDEVGKLEKVDVEEVEEEQWIEVSRKHSRNGRKRRNMVVGRCKENDELTGVKKEWLHLGKLRNGTTVEQVETFLQKYFPNLEVSVECVDSKGSNCSFRLGVDYSNKEILMNSEVWPENVTLRRFLFRRHVGVLPQ
ncbi:hypothetical protein O3M35_008850 [Rhynocoris fuscipes]|uniref:RRM domain-containing protein n=1 Tax=Rhynocoris fuscipes TaxID=488301 RepID=A0AAW1D984_9HEMI